MALEHLGLAHEVLLRFPADDPSWFTTGCGLLIQRAEVQPAKTPPTCLWCAALRPLRMR